MKADCMKKSYLLLITLLGTMSSLRSQNLAIDWSTIDGGGGTCTGGVYSVSGTIGQPDAAGRQRHGAGVGQPSVKFTESRHTGGITKITSN
jgi:hypothetical protein